jgi:hypothetical protein
MMKLGLALLILSGLSFPAAAQSDHKHDHDKSHSHASNFVAIEEGWLALEDVAAEIRAAIKAGNMEALHELAEDLKAVADGLARHSGDVLKSNQLRFSSSLNQLRTLSDRLHTAHENNDVAGAERMVPQLNGMVQLVIASVEGN